MILINEVELATNLAQKATHDELDESELFIDLGDEGTMYEGSIYTDKAQKVFDTWYDYFYGEIMETKN
jgi:hypothetical protein